MPYSHWPLISASQHCRGRRDKTTPDFLPALLRRVLLYGFTRKDDASCCCPADKSSPPLLALPYAKNKHVIGVRVRTDCILELLSYIPRGTVANYIARSADADYNYYVFAPRTGGGFDLSARATNATKNAAPPTKVPH